MDGYQLACVAEQNTTNQLYIEKTTIQKIIPNFLLRIGKYVNQFAIDYLGLKQHCIPTYRYNK